MVITSKYTWYDFLPLNLFREQLLGKVANLFFILVSIFESQEAISISGGKPVILLPLLFVILISMAKDALEDWKRHNSDGEANSAPIEIFEGDKFENRTWCDVKVGDFIKVTKTNKQVPADFVLVYSAGPGGADCGIETKDLDGETNLKFKSVPEAFLNKEFGIAGQDLS